MGRLAGILGVLVRAGKYAGTLAVRGRLAVPGALAVLGGLAGAGAGVAWTWVWAAWAAAVWTWACAWAGGACPGTRAAGTTNWWAPNTGWSSASTRRADDSALTAKPAGQTSDGNCPI